MLTDIFARRYAAREIWKTYGEAERRLLVQCSQILNEDLFPMPEKAEEQKPVQSTWAKINSRLARELGLSRLSTGFQPLGENFVARNYLLAPVEVARADTTMKERLSLIEIGFREMMERVEAAKVRLSMPHPSADKPGDWSNFINTVMKSSDKSQVERYHHATVEINARFQQAGAPLTYNNGFIQLSSDSFVEENIAMPFWDLVNDSMWRNVEAEMQEALDRRDGGLHDGGLHAAKALESTIKIISNNRNWTRGTENGAAQYVDNLVSQANGRFIEVWRGDAIKDFFRSVRNPLGHGAGAGEMVRPTVVETDWAINIAMTWIRYLICHFKATA